MKISIINFLQDQFNNSARQARIMEHLKIDTLDEFMLNDFRKSVLELIEEKQIKIVDTNLYVKL